MKAIRRITTLKTLLILFIGLTGLSPLTAAAAIPDQTLTVGGSSVSVDVGVHFGDNGRRGLTYEASSSDTGVATVSMSGTTVTITPVAEGTASITVTASKNGRGMQETFSATVNPQPNRAPTAVGSISGQTVTVGGSAATVDVSGNFSDPDGDRLSYTASSSDGSKATVSVSGSSVSITPVAEGSATITVTASDPDGLSATQTISATVNPQPNRAPTAVGSISGQTVTVGGSAATVDVSGNFSDPDNDTLTYTASSSDGSKATASVSGSSVSITPVAEGSATVTVTASDPDGLSATQTISVTVNPQPNRAPTAVGSISDQTVTVGGRAASVDVSGNFSDPDGDRLSYTASSSDRGKASVSVSGSTVSITAVAEGSATVTVTASDPDGLSATQSISVTVNPQPNRAPITRGSIPSQTVTVGGRAASVDVSGNFSDPDGDRLSYTASSSDRGKASVSVSGSTVSITPVAEGSATVTVTASDPDGLSATQSISVTVNPQPNRAPITRGSIPSQTVTVGGRAASVDVSGNFSDPDGDRLSYTASSSDRGKASVSVSGSTVSITAVAEGSATVTVTASDGSLSATQSISVTVNPQPNRAPTAVGSISGQTVTVGGSAATVDVSGNFSDADNDTLTYTASSSDDGKATASVSGSTVSITPVAAGSATVTVTASDGSLSATQTISVTVNAQSNPTPDPGTIPPQTLTVGAGSVSVNVGSYFSDLGGRLTYTVTSGDTGVATVSMAGTTVTITPVAAGATTVTVSATSRNGATHQKTFSATVNPQPNRAPITRGSISSQTVTVGGRAASVDVSGNFSDPDGDRLTYTASSSDRGKATVSVSGSTVSITAVAAGSATVTVTASDGSLSATQSISVTVNPQPNRAPITRGSIPSQTVTVGGRAASVDVSRNFSDPDGDRLTYTASSSDRGKATVSVSGSTVSITAVAAGSATVTVTASDGSLSATQSISVTVNPQPNRAPIARGSIPAQTVTVGGRAASVDVSRNFSDPDGDRLSYTASSSDRGKATVSVSGSTVSITAVAAGNATITVTASDGSLSARQTFTVTVNPQPNPTPDPGTIPDQTLTVGEGAVSVDVGPYFSDFGGRLTYTVTSGDTGVATVSMSGTTVTITPVAAGATTVTVSATSRGNVTVQKTISVTVNPRVNRAPLARGSIPSQTVTVGGSAVTVDVSRNFMDPDGDRLRYSATASESGATITGHATATVERGRVTVSVSGATVRITPVAAGTAMIAVTATDTGGLSATQSISVTVNPAPTRTPRDTIPAQTLTVGAGSVSVNVGPYFSDFTGNRMSYKIASANTGVATVSMSGTIVTITPVSAGATTITVSGTSRGNVTIEKTIFVIVNPRPNRAPLARGSIPSQTVTVGGKVVTVDASRNFMDPDGDRLSYTASSSDRGKVSVGVYGSTVSITAVAAGSATITVTASDGSLTATHRIFVTVNPRVNRAPVAVGTISAQTVTVGSKAATVNLSSYFSDPDGDTLNYSVASSDKGKASASVSGATVTITPVAKGAATITVTASDGSLDATQTISVTVISQFNRAPVAVGTIASQTVTVGGKAVTVDVSDNFSDPDGDTLNYSVASSDKGKATADVSGTTVKITPVAAGGVAIILTASDGGLSATQTIFVTVNPQVNRAPLARGSIPSQTVTVGGSAASVDVSRNFMDPDGDRLRYSATASDGNGPTVGLPGATIMGHATATVERGRVTVSMSGATVHITPVAAGTATIAVTATDTGGLSATHRISVTVNPQPSRTPDPGTIPPQTLTVGAGSVSVNVGPYFSDFSGNRMSYKIASANTGVATVSMSGTIVTITPVSAGATTVTVSATSRGNVTIEKTISVTVNPRVNRAPTAVGTIASQTVKMGGNAASVDVRGNFSDADGDTLTYTASTSDKYKATASVSGSTVSITPVAAGSATITVTASDGSLSATQSISVTVNAQPNRAPTAVGTISAQTVTVGGDAASVDVRGNFSDADNDTLTYTVSSSDKYKATVSVSGSTVTITPVAAGSATITVTAADTSKATATQTISVTVNPQPNRAPTAVGTIDTQMVKVGESAATVDVSSNFSDADGDTLTYTVSSSDKSKATASVSGSTVSITPVAKGAATVTVTASDGSLSATQSISVTVNSQFNRAPAVVGTIPSQTVKMGGSAATVEVSPNFSDADGDTLSYAATSSDKSKATVSVSGSTVSITPVAEGKVTVKVTATDSSKASATQSIFVTVGPQNRAPTAVGSISAQKVTVGGDAAELDVSGDFSDADNDTLTYTASSSDGAKATASVSGSTVTITPVAAGSATITVTASDGSLTATQTFTVTVNAQEKSAPVLLENRAPVLVGGTSAVQVLVGGNATELDISSDFSDPDGDTLTYTVSSSDNSKVTASVSGTTVTVTPVAKGKATITITATDPSEASATQTIAVTVKARANNRAPVAVGTIGSQAVSVGGSAATVNVGSSFKDNDGETLTYTASSSDKTKVTVSASGSTVTITPVAEGKATITITATDPSEASATQTIAVTVNPKGSGLTTVGTISGQTVTMGASGKSLNLDSYFNNVGGGAVTYTVHSSNGKKATTTVSGGTLTMAAAQAGTTTITITGKNAQGATASQAFTLTVNRAPAPVGTIPAQTLSTSTNQAVDVSSYFSDPDGDTLSYTVISSNEGAATVEVSGSTVTITAVAAGSATITVYANDVDSTGTQTFSVTVLDNRPPTEQGTISEQTLTLGKSAVSLDVSSFFSDPDGDTLTYSASSAATSKATVAVSESTVTITAVAVGSATITVTASDANASANQTFTATVVTNQAPTAVGTISAQTMGLRSNSRTVDVSGSFSDPDGDSLSYTVSSSDTSKVTASISSATVSLQGVGVGSSTITVTASDGSLTATQTIAASVTANRGPATVGSPPTWTAKVPTQAAFLVSGNFSDADGDALTYTATSADTDLATVSVSGATVTVTPKRIGGVGSTGSGTVQITLTASDGLLSVTQQATLTVQPRSNNSAVTASDAISAQIVNVGGIAKTVDVSSYFSETDGDVIAYSVSSSDAAKATASLSGSTVTITPVAAGSATITVTADDGQASSVDQTIVVTVNRLPQASGTLSAQTLGVGANPRQIEVGDKFSDADSDTLTYTASSSDAAKATVSLTGSTVTLTPVAVGSATITVTATDAGGSATQTFTATVQTNNAPTAEGSISAQTVGVGTNAKPIDVSSYFSDTDGDPLTYTASSSDEAKATVTVSGSTVNITGVAAGSATITVTASDNVATATQTIAVTVSDNQAPTSSTITAPDVRVGWNPTTLDVSGNFSDPDGDALTYTATSSDTSKATVSVSGSTLTLTGKANGDTTITVTATDGSATVSETFTLTVTTNRAPTVSGSIGNITMRAHGPKKYASNIDQRFVDPDGDSITRSVSSANPHAVKATWSWNTNNSRILLDAFRTGTTRVTVTASDGYLTTSTGFDVTVTQRNDNKPVSTVDSIDDQTFDVGDSAVTIDVKSKFRDGDDGGFRPDNLVYTPSSSATGVATATAAGSKITITPVGGGTATITVTADDGQGSSADQTINVEVNRAPAASGSISPQTVSAGKGNRAVDVSSYFSDADGNTLTYTASSSATSKATVSISNSTVTISGVAVGSATVTVTANDGRLNATQTITVTVVSNQAPLAVGTIPARSVGLRANAQSVNVGGNFRDPDGDSLTYTATSSDTSKATVSVSGSTVTMNSFAVGTPIITVTASDGTAVATQTFTLTVNPNRSPYVITNGGGVDLRVPTGYVGIFSYHIRDPDGDPLTYSVRSSHPDKQTLSLSGSRLTIYPKRQGNATITLTASDGLLSASIQFPLTVRPRNNNKPVQKAGSIPAQKFDVNDNAKTVNLSSYFSEADGDPIHYTATSSDKTKATVSLSGSTLTITPVAAGTATVSVTADDGNGSSATQTIAVTVNRAPTAVGSIAAQTMGAGTNARSINVSGNFSDADNDTLTYTVSSSDGTKATASVSGATVTLTPKAVGTATITVTASDSIATVTQTIAATVVTNQGPTAVGSIPAQTLGSGTNRKWIDVSGNFSDPNGDPLTYSATSTSINVSVQISGSSVGIYGGLTGSSTITVSATDNVASATQSFTATAKSNSGGPRLSLVIQRVALGATPKKVDLNNYCSDPDGDAISYSVSSDDTSKATVSLSGSILTITGVAVGYPYIRVRASDGQNSTNSGFSAQVVNNSAPRRTGTFADVSLRVPNSLSYDVSSKFSDSDGNPLTYTATSDQPNKATLTITGGTLKVTARRQGTANISVTANDGGLDSNATGPILKLTVQPRNNNKPVSATGSIPAQTVDVGESPKTVDVSSYFSEADGDAMLYTASSSATSKATASVTGSNVAIAAVAGGTATITVTADDGQGSSATQTIAVTVNRGPTASGTISAKTVSVGKGPQTVDVSSYFSDADGDTLSYSASSSATSKATTSVTGSNVTISGVATGAATVTVTASDGRLSATQTIAVTVVTNQTPTAVGTIPAQTVAIGTTPKTVDVGGYFSDADGDTLTYTATSSAISKATVTISGSTVTLTGVASGSATITVTASDGTAATTQTIAVTVGTNRAPSSLGPLLMWNLRTPNSKSHDFSSHFSDPDGDTLTFTATSSDKTKATASVSGSTVTATAKRAGSTSITVTASDGNLTASQTVPLTVQSRNNNQPVQKVGSIPAQRVDVGGSSKAVDVSGYFSEGDGDLMAYSATSSDSTKATASTTGSTVTLTPVAGGTATVTVTADDGNGSSTTQTIAVTVNRAPTKHGSLAAQTVRVGTTPKGVDVSSGFDDPDNDTLTYTATSSDKTKATVSVSGSTVSITGVAVGSATITVTANDGSLTVNQTFTVTVGTNGTPTAVGSISAQTVGISTNPKTVDVSGNFSDPDGDTLTYTASSSAISKATVRVSGSTVSITGAAAGSATITVTASDGSLSATQTIAVTVTANRAPTVSSTISAQTVGVGTNAKPINASSYFNDPDGDTLTYSASSSATSKATVSVSGSTVSISGKAVGSSTITVTASDGNLNVDQTFTVTVGTNRAPTRSGIFANTSLQVPSSASFDLDTKFSDPDGDALTYTATSSPADMVTLLVTGSTLKVTAKRIGGLGATGTSGTVNISVTASDGLLSSTATGVILTVTVNARQNNAAVQTVGSIPARTLSTGQSATVDVARYFSEADGDAVLYGVSSSATSKATASITGSTVTLTGVAQGSSTVTVTADDGQGSSATQTIAVTVTGNRKPTAKGSIPAQTAGIGTSPATVDVSSYFSDPDGDTLTYTATSNATGKATVAVSGSTLTLTGVAQGSATVTVTATDPSNATAVQNLTVAVINNRAPTAVGTIPTKTVTAGGNAKTVDVGGYFSDPDGDTLTYSATSSDAAKATVSASSATVTISGKAVGTATVTVTASDSANLRVTQTISVTVVTNQAPTTVGTLSALTIRVGTHPATGDVSGYFTDADGDTLTYTASSSATSKATANITGSIISVTGVAVGSATITVTASDGTLTAAQTCTVTVQANRAPLKVGTVAAQILTVGKSAKTVDVNSNFNDPDGDRLTYTVTSSAVGKATASMSGSTVTLSPVAAGSATVTVTANDGGLTVTQPISVTVFDNRAPTAEGTIPNQTVTAGTNAAATVDVKSYFSDADGDTLTYTVSSGDTTTARATVLGSKVSIRGVAAGSASIIVKASDGSAQASQSISVTVTANNAPTRSGTISDKTLRVPYSTSIEVDTAFTDSDGDPLTYTASNSHPTRVGLSVSGSTVTITAKRADSSTWSDTTMTITASDGDQSATQTFVLEVQARLGNRAVTATGSIPAQTVDVGGSASTVDVSSYFDEPDGDVMAYSASSSDASKATVSMSESTVTITPVNGGTATITVTADDGQGSSATQSIAVKVNRTPASAGSIPTQTATVGTNARPLDVSSYFTDADGDSLTYGASSLTASKVTANASGSTVNITGVATGSGTVAVTASDGRLSFAQTFTVTVTANRAPTAVGSIPAGSLGAGANPKVIDVSSYFSDADGDTLTYTPSSSDSSKATASVSGSTVSISGVAAGSATITVTASDGALSATQTIAVTVTTNRAPTTVGTISAMTLGVGTNPTTLDVSSKFSDPDGDTLTYTASSSDTSKATITPSGSPVTITPLALGSTTITLTASDGALSATRTFSVTVGTNRAPVKIGTMSWAPTVPDTTTVNVSAKFVDLDGDTLTYSATSSDTSKATVSVSGANVTMTAKRMGTTTITITASDGSLTGNHQFSVTVSKRNPNEPVETVGSISAKNYAFGASAETLDISSYFSEADGDLMAYTATSSDTAVVTATMSGSTLTIRRKRRGGPQSPSPRTTVRIRARTRPSRYG